MGKAQLIQEGLIEAVSQAIELVSEALTKLDDAGAPGHIGAHLDLAIHQMKSLTAE